MAEENEESAGTLTTGFCQKIVQGTKGANESFLQVLHVDRSAALPKLTIHDGRDAIQIVVSSQAKEATENLQKGAIIQADTDHYHVTVMSRTRTAMFKMLQIIQLECELLGPCSENAPAPYFGANKLNQDSAAAPTPAAAPSPLFGNNRKKPSKASPFMSNPAKRKIQGTGAGNGFTPIANLNPYIGAFKIKGRCTEKGEMRSWNNAKGQGTLFNYTLLDESGDIRVTAFKEDAEKWYHDIIEGEVYTLHKGRVKFDNYQKKNAITMTRDTKLVRLSEEKDSFIKVQYDMKSFKDISVMEVAQSGPKTRVDTCCVVKSVGERQEFIARNTKTYVKRDVICVDQSQIEMSVTFWGKNADEFTPESLPEGTVLILPQAGVSTFGGRTLSAQKVIRNVDAFPKATALQEWWTGGGKNADFKTVSSTLPIRKNEYISFAEARKQKKGIPPPGMTTSEDSSFQGDWITVTGVIPQISISQERPPWYTSEPNGKKKVTQQGGPQGKWVNAKGVEFDTYNCRWLLRFKFADYTQAEWCSAFENVGNQIMEISAKDMEEQFTNNFEQAERYFRDRLFSEWTCSILCKEEVYNDEARLKYQVNVIKELNYIEDTKRMLEIVSGF